MNKYTLTATVVGALVLTATPPPTAHASEAGYLARLGVDYDMNLTAENERYALNVGYVVCQNIRAGVPREQQTRAVYLAIPSATPDQAGGVVFAAHQELCPDTDPDGHGV